MAAFGLSGALAGLSQTYPGMLEAGMEEEKLNEARRASLAKAALGNAMQLLAGGSAQRGPTGSPLSVFPPPQPPAPGQPSQPIQGPPQQGGGPIPGGASGPGMARPPMPIVPPGMAGGAPGLAGGAPGGMPQGGGSQL